jgi:hypothetical protein
VRGACALALALALLGCREPNRPSVLVTVRYTEGQFTFTQLHLAVRSGTAVLAETTVGSKADGGPLGPGETLRVFVDKQYAGSPVAVRVEALEGANPVAAREVDTAALALDTDTEAIVVLLPIEQSPCPSSSPNPTGCCNPATNTSNGPARSERNLKAGFSACGAVGKTCVACDLIRSDRCEQGKCQCGAGAACAPGVACVLGACVCPLQCAGCCDGAGNCVGPSAAQCGASGNTCQACSAGAACSAAGSCANAACGGCGGDECCSGKGCVGVGVFPHCREPTSRACVVCDLARSDACDSSTTCRCGNQPQCAQNQVCAANRTCVPLVR